VKRLVASAVLFVALACSDSNGPSAGGTVAFSYTGAGGGNFSASGNAPSLIAPPPTTTSWAVGYFQGSETYVSASTPRSGGRADIVILRLERTTAGSATIDPSCNIDGSVACTGMEMALNFNGNGDTGDFFCSLTSGTIVLTDVSNNRARGTFSGNGSCVAGTGGTPSAFSVSNGTFDVALVASP